VSDRDLGLSEAFTQRPRPTQNRELGRDRPSIEPFDEVREHQLSSPELILREDLKYAHR
jgi:hypothetical protein